MAGPSIGTWVKVKNKSGRTTSRVIANKFGGGGYSQGQVVTQSEYEGYKSKRAEAMKSDGASAGDRRQAKLPKAALSKQEKAQIMLKSENKKRIMTQAERTGSSRKAITRIGRMEKADRERRKKENPNAPSFVRAQKAQETKARKKADSKVGRLSRLPKREKG